MESMIESFSNIWAVKFPGADLPDISCFRSKHSLEQELKKREQIICKLKLDLQKEEFLALYLNDLIKDEHIWDKIGKGEKNMLGDSILLKHDETDEKFNVPNQVTFTDKRTEQEDLNIHYYDEDKLASSLSKKVTDSCGINGANHKMSDKNKLSDTKLEISSKQDDDSSTNVSSNPPICGDFIPTRPLPPEPMQRKQVVKRKSNSLQRKAISLDSPSISEAKIKNKNNFESDLRPKIISRSFTTEGLRIHSSSSDEDPVYENVEDIPIPFKKQESTGELEVDLNFVNIKAQRNENEEYRHFDSKSNLEELALDNVYSVPNNVSMKIIQNEKYGELEQNLDTCDQEDSMIYDTPNPNAAKIPLTPSKVEAILNISPESLIDDVVEDPPTPTIVVENNMYDDPESPIYANVENLHIRRKMSDDLLSSDDENSCDISDTPYREMTIAEYESLQKRNESDEDLDHSLDGYGFDSDDGPHTPDPERKKYCRSASPLGISRSSSDQRLSKITENDVVDSVRRTDEEKEKIILSRNRKYLVMNLLDTEKCYNDCLDILSKYMKPLRHSAEGSQPILSMLDFKVIFHRAEELFSLHKTFMAKLESLVENWDDKKLIGDAFKIIMYSFDLYKEYINNYKHAMETVLKCRQANEQFALIMDKDIRIPSLKEPLKLDGLLYKPIDRMTQYSLLLNDLLKYTPSHHPDHPVIAEVSGELFDLFEQVNVDTSKKKRRQRHFIKETAVVELVDGERRARNLILFNDVLISAKLKPSRDSYISKWYAALKDISLKPYPNSEANPTVPVLKSECDKLRASLANLRQELRKEQPLQQTVASDLVSPFVKRHSGRQGVRASSRTIDKLKKKIEEQDRLLQLITPIFPVYVYNITGKTYALLVGTETDRSSWIEALKPRIKRWKVRMEGPIQLSSLELQQAFETVLKVRRLASRNEGNLIPVQSAGRPISMDISNLSDYKDAFSGYLYVNIHNAKGFHKSSDTYVVLETDSYGHYFKKAKTKQARGAEPQWDEQFNLEVEACTCLRLTTFNKIRVIGDDITGRVTIDLGRENLTDNKSRYINIRLDKGTVTMNVSLCFSTSSNGIPRLGSNSDKGVFGVPISTVCKREKSDIPAVVISCIKEVEKRGMEEIGIYRLSGIASEIRQLKQLFNEDTQMAVLALSDVDVHAVAGLLKLYLRDLPQSLFTSKLYHQFVSGLSYTDLEDKELYMVDVLHQLPRVNLLTTLYLFDHLRTVVRYEKTNKMGLNNLATVFGPTVLRSAARNDKENERDSCNVGSFDIGALDVMSQVGIFRYFLSLSNNERTKLPNDDLQLWRRLDSEKALQIEMGATQEFLI